MFFDLNKTLIDCREILGKNYPLVYRMFEAVCKRVYHSTTIIDKIPALISLAFYTTVDRKKDVVKCLEKILRLETVKANIGFIDKEGNRGSIGVGGILNYSNYLLRIADLKIVSNKRKKIEQGEYVEGSDIDFLIKNLIQYKKPKSSSPIF